jgi:hypothetical protein
MGQQVHGVSFKKRAPRAIKEIRGFAEKAMVSGSYLGGWSHDIFVFAPSSHNSPTAR